MDKIERAKAVLAMEFLARQVNDEEVFMNWLALGVADGDIDYASVDVADVDEYYLADDNFAELMSTFLELMKQAHDSGGLFCDNILSS